MRSELDIYPDQRCRGSVPSHRAPLHRDCSLRYLMAVPRRVRRIHSYDLRVPEMTMCAVMLATSHTRLITEAPAHCRPLTFRKQLVSA